MQLMKKKESKVIIGTGEDKERERRKKPLLIFR